MTGVEWRGVADAPSEFIALKRAYVRSRALDRPLPISSEHCDTSTYIDPHANIAFRYWHDMTHVILDARFDLDGELTVGTAHLDVLRAYGLGVGSIEWELFYADTLGQLLCAAATGQFPLDQLCFARNVIDVGLTEAIRKELTPDER